MSEQKPLVKNAADETQVANAAKKNQSQRDKELNDLRAVLATPQGRRVMWRFMAECGTFRSIMVASAHIYYNSGKQDVGHYIQSEIVEADAEAYFKILKESNKE